MAALTATTITQRSDIGDMILRTYTVTGTNGDTLAVPQADIRLAVGNPTTAIDLGITVSGSTLTFVTAGAFTANVGVFSRVG